VTARASNETINTRLVICDPYLCDAPDIDELLLTLLLVMLVPPLLVLIPLLLVLIPLLTDPELLDDCDDREAVAEFEDDNGEITLPDDDDAIDNDDEEDEDDEEDDVASTVNISYETIGAFV